jgi:hypothetical protein
MTMPVLGPPPDPNPNPLSQAMWEIRHAGCTRPVESSMECACPQSSVCFSVVLTASTSDCTVERHCLLYDAVKCSMRRQSHLKGGDGKRRDRRFSVKCRASSAIFGPIAYSTPTPGRLYCTRFSSISLPPRCKMRTCTGPLPSRLNVHSSLEVAE